MGGDGDGEEEEEGGVDGGERGHGFVCSEIGGRVKRRSGLLWEKVEVGGGGSHGGGKSREGRRFKNRERNQCGGGGSRKTLETVSC